MDTNRVLGAMTKETTPGVAAPLTENDFLLIAKDGGMTVTPEVTKVDTSYLTGDRISTDSVKTQVVGSFSMSIAMRAAEVAGEKPESDPVLEGAGFQSSQTASDTVLAGSTASSIVVADASGYKIGQMISINNAQSFIKEIDEDTDTLTLEYALSVVPEEDDEIRAQTAYKLSGLTNNTFTVRKIKNKKKVETLAGSVITSFASANLAAGGVPQYSVSGTSTNYVQQIQELAFDPIFNKGSLPIAKGSCLVINGVAESAAEFSFTFTQTTTPINDFCEENVASEQVGTGTFVVTGTAVIWSEDDVLDYKADDQRYTFCIAPGLPALGGGKDSNVGYYFTDCKIDSVDPNSTSEGLFTQTITWSCEVSPDKASTHAPCITF